MKATATVDQIRGWLRECEEEARENGWQGPWEPQQADQEYVLCQLGRRLTLDEAKELGIPGAFRASWVD